MSSEISPLLSLRKKIPPPFLVGNHNIIESPSSCPMTGEPLSFFIDVSGCLGSIFSKLDIILIMFQPMWLLSFWHVLSTLYLIYGGSMFSFHQPCLDRGLKLFLGVFLVSPILRIKLLISKRLSLSTYLLRHMFLINTSYQFLSQNLQSSFS